MSFSEKEVQRPIQNNQWSLFSGKGHVALVLVQREAFELWRNPRFRLLATIPFFFVVVLHLISVNELMLHFFGIASWLWLIAGVGFYAAALILLTFSHNTFAYDGRGLLNLLHAPITPMQILRSKAQVHSAVSLILGVSTCILCWLYSVPDIDTILVIVSVIGIWILVPIVLTIGLWISVHYPMKFDASLNRRERQPLLVSIAGFSGCALGLFPLVIASRLLGAGSNVSVVITGLVIVALVAWRIHFWGLQHICNDFTQRQTKILSAITRV